MYFCFLRPGLAQPVLALSSRWISRFGRCYHSDYSNLLNYDFPPTPASINALKDLIRGVLKEKDEIVKEKDEIVKKKDEIVKAIVKDKIEIVNAFVKAKDEIVKDKDEIVKGKDEIVKDKNEIVRINNEVVKAKEIIINSLRQNIIDIRTAHLRDIGLLNTRGVLEALQRRYPYMKLGNILEVKSVLSGNSLLEIIYKQADTLQVPRESIYYMNQEDNTKVAKLIIQLKSKCSNSIHQRHMDELVLYREDLLVVEIAIIAGICDFIGVKYRIGESGEKREAEA